MYICYSFKDLRNIRNQEMCFFRFGSRRRAEALRVQRWGGMVLFPIVPPFLFRLLLVKIAIGHRSEQ